MIHGFYLFFMVVGGGEEMDSLAPHQETLKSNLNFLYDDFYCVYFILDVYVVFIVQFTHHFFVESM